MKKRILSFVLSAVLLLMPIASLGEQAVATYYAGELTTVAMDDSYRAGNQINLNAAFGLDFDAASGGEAMKALANLIGKSTLHMSFYDDFGTGRIHAELNLDDLNLLTADVLMGEDGSMQAMTNLTGNYVLALPAGALLGAGYDTSDMEAASIYDYDFETEEGIAAFRALPAKERLKITGADMVSLLINHLLGWVSYMQMDNDDQFYTFDDTYLEATDKRDPVAQRMFGTIKADSFTTLFNDIAMTVADTQGEFQLAIAEVLADMGVTRYQARVFTDALFTEETIDPALDYVQTSYYIVKGRDKSPIQYDDVAYFFKKLRKCTQRIWENSTDNVLGMVVSYDDFGGMTGFDADLKQFTTVLPYEGTFEYNIKTDDSWQRLHNSHGELQIFNNNRVIGDLDIKFGQDVLGVNENYFVGHMDVINQNDQTSVGFGIDAGMDYNVKVEAPGQESETFEGGVVLNARMNGEDIPLVSATMSGLTTVDQVGFGTAATAALGIADLAMLVADVTVEQSDYEEINFAGGRAISLDKLNENSIEAIKSEVKTQAAKLGVKLITKPDVMSSLLTIASALGAN